MNTTLKSISAVYLLFSANLVQAALYNINTVMNGSSGFNASLFHDASGASPMSGSSLADIPSIPVISGTYDDISGDFIATMNVSTGGSFTLSGSGFLFSGGSLASNNQLNISFTNPSGALVNDEIGFLPGYICCGSTDQDPNSFVANTSGEMIMSLWGANFGGGTFAGSYDDASGARLATYGMDLRLSLTPVPVPAAAWLFGSGLIGLVGLAKRRKA